MLLHATIHLASKNAIMGKALNLDDGQFGNFLGSLKLLLDYDSESVPHVFMLWENRSIQRSPTQARHTQSPTHLESTFLLWGNSANFLKNYDLYYFIFLRFCLEQNYMQTSLSYEWPFSIFLLFTPWNPLTA